MIGCFQRGISLSFRISIFWGDSFGIPNFELWHWLSYSWLLRPKTADGWPRIPDRWPTTEDRGTQRPDRLRPIKVVSVIRVRDHEDRRRPTADRVRGTCSLWVICHLNLIWYLDFEIWHLPLPSTSNLRYLSYFTAAPQDRSTAPPNYRSTE